MTWSKLEKSHLVEGLVARAAHALLSGYHRVAPYYLFVQSVLVPPRYEHLVWCLGLRVLGLGIGIEGLGG